MDRPRHSDGRVHGAIVGCHRHDGCWLLIRRSQQVAAPGQVCFPGGAIEPGEERITAAMRELREELSLEVKILNLVWRHDFADRPLTLWGYLGTIGSQTPIPDGEEVDEAIWMTTNQVRTCSAVMARTCEFLDALLETTGDT